MMRHSMTFFFSHIKKWIFDKYAPNYVYPWWWEFNRKYTKQFSKMQNWNLSKWSQSTLVYFAHFCLINKPKKWTKMTQNGSKMVQKIWDNNGQNRPLCRASRTIESNDAVVSWKCRSRLYKLNNQELQTLQRKVSDSYLIESEKPILKKRNA